MGRLQSGQLQGGQLQSRRLQASTAEHELRMHAPLIMDHMQQGRPEIVESGHTPLPEDGINVLHSTSLNSIESVPS